MELRQIKLKKSGQLGWFHKLGIGMSDTVSGKVVSITIAIVELETGEMISVEPQELIFIKLYDR